jgi:hypothetical protein
MSTQVAMSAMRPVKEAAASRRSSCAGTTGMNDAGVGPTTVMPCSRRIQRV